MAKKATKELDPTRPIFQLKISLQEIEPLIWRRVQVDDCSLSDVHEIIQAAMGWQDEHMHCFEIGEKEYSASRGDDFEDSRRVRLSRLVERKRLRFIYEYDFGDEWRHTVEIEETLAPENRVRYPRCTGGARACPPEDCGGPYGYPYFLDKIQNPDHPEHEEMLEWVGGEFDPEKFDVERVNRELQSLRPWLGRRRKRLSPPAMFAKGDQVRVKAGVVHAEYPDIPMGGWTGTVINIGWLTPISYEILWSEETMAQVHPVYAKRCRRDDSEPEACWVDEWDLEAASGEAPSTIEQPANLVTPPLSMDNEEDFDDEDFEDDEKMAAPCEFPIGTIACYGPDDKITTKIAAGVILHEGAEPILKRWVATDVMTNPKVEKQIDRFFKKYGVTKVAMSEGNMGCPHEEGKDFPVGGDCPFCPFWKGKQGSGAKG